MSKKFFILLADRPKSVGALNPALVYRKYAADGLQRPV